MIVRGWDIQVECAPWFSLGFHFDHTDPSLTFHLPWVIVAFGRLKIPGFVQGWSLRGLNRDTCGAALEALRKHDEKRGVS